MTDWGRVFLVAIVGLSGVFAGLIVLNLCTNLLGWAVRIVEQNFAEKK